MLYIFTGDGKGKTTAALGSALRAVGEGKRVLMIQFIKGPWKSGEDFLAASLEPHFKLLKMGKGFVGILGDTLPRAEHEMAACAALAFAQSEAESGRWDMLILDELNNALQLELIPKDAALKTIKAIRSKIEHLIITGRDALPELMARADLVTDMRDVKHPYEHGVKAKRGLEY